MSGFHSPPPPGAWTPGVRHSVARTVLAPVEAVNHQYRILFIDDDTSKWMKEKVVTLPAFTDLVKVVELVTATNRYLLQGAHLVALENLSLRNGLPLPF